MRTTLVNGHPTIIRTRSVGIDPARIISALEDVLDGLLRPKPWLNPTWWSRIGRVPHYVDGYYGATQSVFTRSHEITHDQTLDAENSPVPANNLKTRITSRHSKLSISILGMDPSFGLYRPSITKPTEPLLRLMTNTLQILRWVQDHGHEDVTLLTKGLASIQSEERGTPIVQIASPRSPIILREEGPEMAIQPRAGTLRCMDLSILETDDWTGVHISPTIVDNGGHPVDIISGIHQVERLMADPE